MAKKLNIFDRYSHLENRLTHALGVTLERSPLFKKEFIKAFAPSAKSITRKSRVELQLAKGRSEDLTEKTGIPDLVIIDKTDRAIIIESKVGSVLSITQLRGHENRSRQNNLCIQSALAITGRDHDRDKIRDAIRNNNLSSVWQHVTWRQIYHLSSRLAFKKDIWAKELLEYMNIVSTELDEQKMAADVKIIDFSGIPFKTFEDFDFRLAKRVLRSLIECLDEDKKFLSAIGFSKGQVPRHRKSIDNGLQPWDFFSPVSHERSHKESHHFTVSIGQERLNAMLTVPNGSTFRGFRKHLKQDEDSAFESLIEQFLKDLERRGVLKAGGKPCIWIGQRRYKGRKTLFSIDGEMSFDIRTLKGQPRQGAIPPIRAQPEWLNLCKSLILGKKGNVQFQIGVWFPYRQCNDVHTPKAADLVKASFESLMPFVKAFGR